MKLMVFLCLCAGMAQGLPNAVLGALAASNSPLDGRDLTEEFLAGAAWGSEGELPGRWHQGISMAASEESYLMARPKVFGLDTVLVKATRRGEALEEVQVTFADAGSFFGYYQEKIPEGLSRKEAIAEMRSRMAKRQLEFQELYQDRLEKLEAELKRRSGKARETQRGRTRALRAELREFQVGDRMVRLLAAPDRLLRLSIRKMGKIPGSWLDQSAEALSSSVRLRALAKQVQRSDNGDVFLNEVPIVPQGYRPYCGLNTLTMVARYLGLNLDEDWLAVAGKFQNTGSAAGSDMMGIYKAVAKEAGFSMARSRDYSHASVRRSLQAGMPVIVWRRWGQDRDRMHTRISRAVDAGEDSQYGELDRQSLPNDSSPLHASVLVGYNDERKEVLFLESWAGQTKPRRMPVAELDATDYYTFLFQP
ncbi:C39 family peptidase [Akkermansiaceae bacterium]|nr:C39 family peptidase [Akkermansiaceae bacterium]MDA7888397.1 C39 family peptidase [Akkermansiaceae bacterium]